MHRRTDSFRSIASRRFGVIPAVLALVAGTSVGLAQDGGPGDGVEVSDMDLVELHVNKEDLTKVLQLLSLQSQRNIIPSPSVEGTVTADLYSVTFYEALDAILNSAGYGYLEEGNFIYVYTKEELAAIEEAKRKRVAQVYTLDYLNAVDARAFVEIMLSGDGASISSTSETEDFQLQSSGPTGADGYAAEATLVIYDYEENVAQIVQMLDELDTKPQQVLVEATILQTALTENNAYGVDFSILSDLDFFDFAGSGGPLGVVDDLISGQSTDGADNDIAAPEPTGLGSSTGVAANSNIGNVAGPATLKVGVVNEDVAVFLRVLDSVTDTTIVSNPKLLTLNRQAARVLVGQRVGYLNTTFTDAATTTSVEFLDTGTELAVRPFVSQDGLIRLELRPQISSATFRNILDNNGNTITIPDEDTTELSTNIQVRDGQTIVLGGLFTETTTANRRQIPVLGNMPLIGAAFRGHDDTTSRSEIIFMVTPSLVNDTRLTEDGELAMEFVDHAVMGARDGLLPWSRERLVGQWLIKARNYADEGKLDQAVSMVRKALNLMPMSPDARALLEDLTNEKHRMPSRSIMEGVLNKELLGGPLEPADGRRRGTWWKQREQAAMQQAQLEAARNAAVANTNRERGADEGESNNGEEFSSADSDESFQQRSAVTPLFSEPAQVESIEAGFGEDEASATIAEGQTAKAAEPSFESLFDNAPVWTGLSEREIAELSSEPYSEEGFEVAEERFETPSELGFADPAFASAFEDEPGAIEAPEAVENFQTAEAVTEPARIPAATPVAEAVRTATARTGTRGPVAQDGPEQTATIVVPRFDSNGWVYSERVAFFGDPETLLIGAEGFEWVPLNSTFGVEPATSEVLAGQAWVLVPDTTGGGMYRASVPTWATFGGFEGERFSSVFESVDDQR
ncbi:MAG: type II secretion system protein GspD [Phycisphaerales bacterium JB040]